ncbi:MAG TPA: hypothetical protein VHM19_13370 [Polyangiales bacterium]|jgi:hypothetical protein|nr:hypothetical protein [Polyangiales bacterium]
MRRLDDRRRKSRALVRAWLLALGIGIGLWPATQAHAHEDGKHDEGDSAARFMIGVDLSRIVSVSLRGIKVGNGMALRLGGELDALIITMIPEAIFSYDAFDDSGLNVSSARAGGRLRFLKVLEPGLFLHAGVASVDPGAAYWSPMLDGGLTLDFTLLPLIDLGVHAAYDGVLASGHHAAFGYGSAGAHVAFVF